MHKLCLNNPNLYFLIIKQYFTFVINITLSYKVMGWQYMKVIVGGATVLCNHGNTHP